MLGRDLRDAGLPIGSGQVMTFVESVGEIDCRIRSDFYAAAKSTLVTSPEHIPTFDAIFGRIRERKLPYWADPGQTQEGKINHHDGGRGVYFPDPDNHMLEIITRPYGSGS